MEDKTLPLIEVSDPQIVPKDNKSCSTNNAHYFYLFSKVKLSGEKKQNLVNQILWKEPSSKSILNGIPKKLFCLQTTWPNNIKLAIYQNRGYKNKKNDDQQIEPHWKLKGTRNRKSMHEKVWNKD